MHDWRWLARRSAALALVAIVVRCAGPTGSPQAPGQPSGPPTPPRTASAASERVILTLHQPFANHNGGEIAFGPDGYLYIGLGDGGSEGDPSGNGQNRRVLLGKILRIDVDGPRTLGKGYAIPATNP